MRSLPAGRAHQPVHRVVRWLGRHLVSVLIHIACAPCVGSVDGAEKRRPVGDYLASLRLEGVFSPDRRLGITPKDTRWGQEIEPILRKPCQTTPACVPIPPESY